MAKYQVDWSKTYVHSGQVMVEADSSEEAEQKVLNDIGNLTGSSQYDPNEDYVAAMKIHQNIK